MNNIETFKSPIVDGENQVGTMMIIRGVFPPDADLTGANDYFEKAVKIIANKEFPNGHTRFMHLDDPSFRMAVIIENNGDKIPFKNYSFN